MPTFADFKVIAIEHREYVYVGIIAVAVILIMVLVKKTRG